MKEKIKFVVEDSFTLVLPDEDSQIEAYVATQCSWEFPVGNYVATWDSIDESYTFTINGDDVNLPPLDEDQIKLLADKLFIQVVD
jgi:hypothetical protein